MSLIRSNILKIFQSTLFGTGVRTTEFFKKSTVRYCLVPGTTTIRENHCNINTIGLAINLFHYFRFRTFICVSNEKRRTKTKKNA